LVGSDNLRFGIIIPSSNTTMEQELRRVLPEKVSLHSARLRLTDTTEKELIRMERGLEKEAQKLLDIEPDVIAYGCTLGSLVRGKEHEDEIGDRIRLGTNVPVVIASEAVLQALTTLGARRVTIFTPYTDNLNRLERKFLEENGFRVQGVEGMDMKRNVEIGRLSPETVFERIKKRHYTGSDALFISCTNLRTFDFIQRMEAELGIPVVSSNSATLWMMLIRSKASDIEVKSLGRLLKMDLDNEKVQVSRAAL
jgi:maleate isomerase